MTLAVDAARAAFDSSTTTARAFDHRFATGSHFFLYAVTKKLVVEQTDAVEGHYHVV